MPPSDQEPRYRFVDSNGNVVGALWGDGNGNVKIADETDTQTIFGPNGISTPALESDDTVSKINNGVVYAGHPDFATLQDAIDHAVQNDLPTVALEPRADYTEDITLDTGFDNDNFTLRSFAVGGGTNYNLPTIDGDVTLDATSASLIGVHVSGTVELSARQHLIQDCVIDTSLSVTSFPSGGGHKIRGVDRTDITVTSSGGAATIVGCTACDIILDGDSNIVVGNADVAITDNGVNNQLGFNT